ncbi:hypothetical protein KCU98_g136, partial [Aureobasidium melanogenum]
MEYMTVRRENSTKFGLLHRFDTKCVHNGPFWFLRSMDGLSDVLALVCGDFFGAIGNDIYDSYPQTNQYRLVALLDRTTKERMLAPSARVSEILMKWTRSC